MRLHALTVRGFGPFRDEQVVDFDALTATGLFLLTGDTGAGKSSVLDAVVYALYGRVPGARGSAARLRSDHADPDLPTRVVLDLTLRGTRLRVTRVPEWTRPKRRGAGTTREPTKVLLERRAGGHAWETVSTRVDEIGDELGRLLGMTHDQFCQVVLLPQGDFAQFLRADAETRKRLLERLFGTERFSAVEAWLSETRRERGQQLALADQQVHGLLARLAEASVEPRPPDDELPGIDDQAAATAWAALQAERAVDALTGARTRLAAARAGRERAQSALEQARRLADRQQRLVDLQERAATLARGAPEVEAARAALLGALQAAGLEPFLDAVRDASEVLATAVEERARTGAEALAATGGSEVDDLAGVARALRAETTRLEDLLDDERLLTTIAAELVAADDRVADLERVVAAEHAWLALAGEREADEARLERLRTLAATSPGLEARLVLLDAQVAGALRRDVAAAGLERAVRRRTDAVDAAQAARERWLRLREDRLAAMAGELAAGLRPGAPCPVCGGVEHPAPAPTAAAAQVGAAEEDAALVEVRRLDASRERASAEHDDAAAALRTATVDAGGGRAVRDLEDDRAVVRAELAVATAAAAEVGPLERVVQAAATESTARRASLDTALAELGRAQAGAAQLRTRADDLLARVEEARQGDVDLASRRVRLAAAADACDRAVEADLVVARASAELDRQVARAGAAAARAGFDDLDAAADAVLTPSRSAGLEAAVASADEERVLVAAGLADPGLVGVSTEPPADVDAAVQSLAAATAAAEDASGEVAGLEQAAEATARLGAELVTALADRVPVEHRFTVASGLAALAEGAPAENRLRMRLSYYVLSARLEQVAEAASERLLRMTDGRFSLAHSDERVGGNRRSGLGLVVVDAWYGTTRDPSTLSGGETFMASLALALGLADVVVAEAGGAFMDTLFVDEGFGSLDADTLDAVLDVLDGLREGGRSVGLVSHVAELRQRVPAQLMVERARSGSRVSLSA